MNKITVTAYPRHCDACGYEFHSVSCRPTCPKCKKTRGHWMQSSATKTVIKQGGKYIDAG